MKSLSLILVLALMICYIEASPLNSLDDTASTLATLALQTRGSLSPTPTSTRGRDGASSDEAEPTVPDILWPCLATLAISFWNAIHPDVPAQEGRWYALKNRVSLLWAMVLSPECVINWAMLQHQQATGVATSCQDKNWTKAHGFLLIMGGLVLRNDEGLHELNYQTSTSRITLDGSSRNEEMISKIDWSDVTEGDIKALSKADSFSKLIMACTAGRFSLQCILKISFNKKVTSLEVVTLAYTLLVGFVLWNWRNKPFDIQQPIKVYTTDYPRKAATNPTDHVTFMQSIAKTLPKLREIKFTSLHAPSWLSIFGHLYSWFRFLLLDPVAPLMDNSFFFDCNPSSDLTKRRVVVGVATFVFGAVHSIFSVFLVGSVEIWIWRAASMAIMIWPFLLYACFVLDRSLDNREVGKSRWISRLTISRLKAIIVFLYIISRGALIVLPLIDLRRLAAVPKGRLGWLEWIPHF